MSTAKRTLFRKFPKLAAVWVRGEFGIVLACSVGVALGAAWGVIWCLAA